MYVCDRNLYNDLKLVLERISQFDIFPDRPVPFARVAHREREHDTLWHIVPAC